MRRLEAGFVATVEIVIVVGLVAFALGAALAGGGTFWLMTGQVQEARANLKAATAGAAACVKAVEDQNSKVDGFKEAADKDRAEAKKHAERALAQARSFYQRAADLAATRTKDPEQVCKEAEALADEYLASRRAGA